MATISFTYVDRCGGGGHYRCDVSMAGWGVGRFVYTTDEVRESLADLDQEERERIALAIMKIHMQGKTRQEMVTEFQAGPIVITI